MRRIFFALSMIFTALAVRAQVNVDSLFAIWNNQDLPDTSRLKVMDELTWNHYRVTDLDSAQYYGQLMLDLALKKRLKKYEAIALKLFGVIQFRKGELDKSLDFFTRDLALREEIGDKKGMGSSLSNIANCYSRQSNYDYSIDYYEKALLVFEEIGDKELTIHALNSMGHVYAMTGDYSNAIQITTQALAKLDGDEPSQVQVSALINLGRLYMFVGDLEQAQESTEAARDMAKEINFTEMEISALLLLADIQSRKGNHDAAIAFCEEALSKKTKAMHWAVETKALTSIGYSYHQKKELDKALTYYMEVHKIASSINSKQGLVSSTLYLGFLYYDKNDGKTAIKWCEESLSLAKEADDIVNQTDACECLYKANKLVYGSSKALEYHEQFLIFDDSLQKDETSKKLQKMEFEKQILADSIANAEADRLVEEAHKEEVRQKNQTRNILGGGGILLLILAGGIYSRLQFISKSKATLQVEKDRSENLLLNILPAEIAEELKEKGKAAARDFDMVSILFTDFKGFTAASEKLSAQDLVSEINTCFEAFDNIMGKYNIEKIKTIGDAYMAAGGLPVPFDLSIKNTVIAALEMQAFISKRKIELDALEQPAFEMRVGVHTGPVVAGIVGVKKFQYDIWGDTVNTASRMESSGKVGKVNISQATYELLKDDTDFNFESRGKIEAKGKGKIEMYFVSSVERI